MTASEAVFPPIPLGTPTRSVIGTLYCAAPSRFRKSYGAYVKHFRYR